MSEPWYEVVAAVTPLTQGDLIESCPVLSWTSQPLGDAVIDELASLEMLTEVTRADVIVLSQACDLEHGKVRDVVLCPCFTLSALKAVWENQAAAKRQTPTEKAWRRYCDDVAAGYAWNQALLNSFPGPPPTEIRVVDFLRVFTIPKAFLEQMLAQRGPPRLRLRPPFREHLSQAFARFFMRVGLPTPVDKAW